MSRGQGQGGVVANHAFRRRERSFLVKSAVILLACMASSLLAESPDGENAPYEIRKAARPPVIDGRMEKGEWGSAFSCGPFCGPFNPMGPDLSQREEFGTEAYVLWDAERLYVAFVCRQPPPFYADKIGRDAKLHEQDVVELFLDVAGDMMEYAEFQASPAGAVSDGYHKWSVRPDYPADKIDWGLAASGHAGDASWNLEGLKAAAGTLLVGGTVQGWVVEMEIPVAPLLAMRKLPERLAEGQSIRLNLIRYVYELDGKGGRVHRHLNWGRTMKGCPHVSPSAMRKAVCAP